MLIETYIFEANPNADIKIVSNLYKDANFVWDREPFAYDANFREIVISSDKVVKATEFTKEYLGGSIDTPIYSPVEYPITIDPTSTFASSSSDTWGGFASNIDWPSARDSTTGGFTSHVSNIVGSIEAYHSTSVYGYYGFFNGVSKILFYFDTSGIPDGATIDSVTLKLYSYSYHFNCGNAPTFVIQSGMPTYPHDPAEDGDFLYSHYAGDGGSIAYDAIGAGYNTITLSATGESWINKAGMTKFMVSTDYDIDDVTPPDENCISGVWEPYMYEKGTGYWPQLSVTYSASALPTVTANAATDLSATTSKLHLYLNDDGGEANDVRFAYNTTSGAPYAFNTTWKSGYTTAQSYDEVITALTNSTTYYFIAQARNDLGTSNSTELSFDTLTPPAAGPTEMLATPRSNSEVSVIWIREPGSQNTMVRMKVGEYPTTYTDGANVYFGVSGSVLVDDLDAGTTYYFRAWGEDADIYSTGYTSDMATTYAGSAEGAGPVEDPSEPSGLYAPSSEAGLANLPFYDLVNRAADSMLWARANLWVFLASGIVIGLGIGGTLISKSLLGGLIGAAIGIAGAWNVGLFPWWILLIYIFLAGGILLIARRA